MKKMRSPSGATGLDLGRPAGACCFYEASYSPGCRLGLPPGATTYAAPRRYALCCMAMPESYLRIGVEIRSVEAWAGGHALTASITALTTKHILPC